MPEDVNTGRDNEHTRGGLTFWGVYCSAEVRRHNCLDADALARNEIKVADGFQETQLAIAFHRSAPRSPEQGHPYLLSTGDAERLRDLLNHATDRGYLPRPLIAGEKAEYG